MSKVMAIGLAALVIIAMAVAFLLFQQQSSQPVETSLMPGENADSPAATSERGGALQAEAQSGSNPVSASAGDRSAKASRRRLGPKAQVLAVDKAARAAMLISILEKINRKDQTPKEGDSEQADKPGSLSKDYIQQQVREIVPLVKECYEMSLENHPELTGDLKVQFTIVGDEEYGGLVEESLILDDSSLAHSADLVECVRETMYAIKLKAPEGGGRVVVKYPFRFAAE